MRALDFIKRQLIKLKNNPTVQEGLAEAKKYAQEALKKLAKKGGEAAASKLKDLAQRKLDSMYGEGAVNLG